MLYFDNPSSLIVDRNTSLIIMLCVFLIIIIEPEFI